MMLPVESVEQQTTAPATMQLLFLQLLTSVLQQSNNVTSANNVKLKELEELINVEEFSKQQSIINNLQKYLKDCREENEELTKRNREVEMKVVEVVLLHGNLSVRNQELQEQLMKLVRRNHETGDKLFVVLSRDQDTKKKLTAAISRSQDLQQLLSHQQADFHSKTRLLQAKQLEQEVRMSGLQQNLSTGLLEDFRNAVQKEHLCQLEVNSAKVELQNVTSARRSMQVELDELQRRLVRQAYQLNHTQMFLQNAESEKETLSKDLKKKDAQLTAIRSSAQLLTLQPELSEQISHMNASARDALLMEGLRAGNLTVVRLLLLHGTNPNLRQGGYSNETPLHRAASKGAVALARELLYAGAVLDAKDTYADRPLHWAAEKGQLEMCRFLLDQGAQVDARTVYQNTPLHLAASEGYLAVVQLLVKRGADPGIRNHLGFTPQGLAAKNGRRDVEKWLAGAA